MRRVVRVPLIRRLGFVAPVLAFAALSPAAAPAQASCSPSVVGVASSGGTATTTLDVCAPAWGRPSGTDTGRKVG